MRSNTARDDGHAITSISICDDQLLSAFSPAAFKNARSIITDNTRLLNLIDHMLAYCRYFSILDSLHLSDFGVHNICCSFPNLVCLCLRETVAITNKSLEYNRIGA